MLLQVVLVGMEEVGFQCVGIDFECHAVNPRLRDIRILFKSALIAILWLTINREKSLSLLHQAYLCVSSFFHV